MRRNSTVVRLAGLSLLLGSAAAPLGAQSTLDFMERSLVLVGYSASPPQQMAGAAVAVTSAGLGAWGLMADFRLTTDSPRGDTFFLSDWTPNQADTEGDRFNRERTAWTTIGLSLVKGLTPEFAVYAGGGAAWKSVYIQYEDEFRDRGAPLGFYWVEDEDQSAVFGNVVLGAFLRMGGRLAVQVGGQSAPRSFVFAGHFRVR